MDGVILLTRLNGQPFVLNPDLLERAEATPDTVLTLVDGAKFVVADSLDDVMAAVVEFRATVVARAQQMSDDAPVPRAAPTRAPSTERAVPGGAVPLRRRLR
jgi:flagellar protein FlbD